MKKIFRILWSHLRGEKFVSDFKMVGSSLWWDKEWLSVSSFDKIKMSTAIAVRSETSVKIYFPKEIQIVDTNPTMYKATIKLYKIMLPNELGAWINQINNHPFA